MSILDHSSFDSFVHYFDTLLFSLSLFVYYIYIVNILPTSVGDYFAYLIMINRRLQSAPVSGYYEYLSRIRHRVNVTPYEGGETEGVMTQTPASTASPSVSSTVDTDENNAGANSFPVENSSENPVDFNEKNITEWSSAEVKHWIEEQCRKFELKRATTEKFQMNGRRSYLM